MDNSLKSLFVFGCGVGSSLVPSASGALAIMSGTRLVWEIVDLVAPAYASLDPIWTAVNNTANNKRQVAPKAIGYWQ